MASLQNSPSLYCKLSLRITPKLGSSNAEYLYCSRRGVSFVVKAEQTMSPSQGCSKRSTILLGIAGLFTSILPASVFAEDVPANYESFVDLSDGYSYYYPADWREFDYLGHDSAFKDRYLQLQNVRLSFVPTIYKDIHDLGPMEEVIPDMLRSRFAAPSQRITIFDMQERAVDGKNYYTIEYELRSPNFARTAFATVAIANERYYTLIVGANERRWKRYRDQLKVVADSFKVLDI